MAYEEIGVETDPNVLAEAGFDVMRAAYPAWEPIEGAPETMLIEIGANWAADAAYLLTTWADSIFKHFGASLQNLAQNDAVPATITSTWTAGDTLGHTIEAGTEVQVQNDAGDWIAFSVVDEVTIPAASSATAAGEVQLEAIEPGVAGNGLSGTAESIEAFDWLDSVALVGTSAGGADAETDAAYLTRLVRRLQLMAPRPIKPEDFAVLATDIDGIYRAVAIDRYNPEHNLLTLNAASVETNVNDWNATTNCSIAQSATHAADNSNSLRLSSTAGGTMVATQDSGVSGTAITAGQQYTASAFSRAGASARTIRVGINFYDSGGTIIGATHWGSTAVNATANFNTEAKVSYVAPSTAAYASIVLEVQATGGAAELHYFDKMQLREGSISTPWVAGGTNPTNNEATVTVAAMASDGTAPPSLTLTEVEDYLTDLREIGFTVYAVGPDDNPIDVDYEVTLVDGADEVEVLAAIDAAIEEYLDPANSGTPSSGESDLWVFTDTVQIFELATLINNVGGVDSVVFGSLLINGSATDHQLYGIAPVTSPGTITGAVV